MGFGERRFGNSEDSSRFWERPGLANSSDAIVDHIRRSVVGDHHPLDSPFGPKQLTYCDWSASGRALSFVEDYISSNVLPLYGNTHTNASRVGITSQWMRDEARGIIQAVTNASSVHDAVIFAGSGCTAAVHKLVNALQLNRFSEDPRGQPVVFVSLHEHHSNLLPWRESPYVQVVQIDEDQDGHLDCEQLASQLSLFSGRPLLMGAFTAASNVTGELADVLKITALLKSRGALSFWDYASAAPGTGVDMNPVGSEPAMLAKDAVFLAPHKFAGGPSTPGVLIAKRALWKNPVPSGHGGGSVFYVTAEEHRYLWQLEEREEGGTPDIVGSIRAGLVFHVHRTVSTPVIVEREQRVAARAMAALVDCPGLKLLGNTRTDRLPVFSFVVLHEPSGRYLHHNFVATLLNDLFGVQARAGCACAGPYAQWLLGIDLKLARELENCVLDDRTGLAELLTDKARRGSGRELLRPGFVRISFHYSADDAMIDFVCAAIRLVASEGWKLLPSYSFDPETAEWTHRNFKSASVRRWLSDLSLHETQDSTGAPAVQFKGPQIATPTTGLVEQERYYSECLAAATKVLHEITKSKVSVQSELHLLDESREQLRWFLYPSEAVEHMAQSGMATMRTPLFTVKTYGEQCVAGAEAEASAETVKATVKATVKETPTPVIKKPVWKYIKPPKKLMTPTEKGIQHFGMIKEGDRVMIGVSGGKDSLSMVHVLKCYQQIMKHRGVNFTLGAVTVDPQADGFDPRPLKLYFEALGMDYFFEEQPILELARGQGTDINSICSFCARMKRGRLYAAMRREGYNVLALGQHLDDVAESFVMAMFFNGVLRTIKAHYTVAQEDLRVIRPMTFVRERDLRAFADSMQLPVIEENCPACFEAPKERVRCKQLLAAQEHQTPQLFNNLRAALLPCLSIDNARPDDQDMQSIGSAGESSSTDKQKKRRKGGPKLGKKWSQAKTSSVSEVQEVDQSRCEPTLAAAQPSNDKDDVNVSMSKSFLQIPLLVASSALMIAWIIRQRK